ncbi:MAG: hypothetical protein ABIL20_03270 [candidate division WOR-3 bacterium]
MPIFAILFFTWFDWQVIKTKNYTIICKPDYEYEAIQTLYNLEYYRTNVINLTGNNIRNLPVVIEDIGTLSNGFANPFFYNIHIFTYPPGFERYLEGIESWHRLVSVHEFTHISHMTKTRGISRLLAGIFGAPFQSNMYSPGWIIEGITVYSESQISPYEGRLNDGFFDSYLETRICEKKFPTIIEATNEPLAFPYGKIYLYGGELFDFLSMNYGEEKFAQFFSVYGSYPWAPISALFPALGLDMAAKRVYGKTFTGLFSEWQRFEKNRLTCEPPNAERLTKTGWLVSSLSHHQNKIYYIREMPIKLNGFRYRELTQIIELNLETKKEQVFATLNSTVTTTMKLYHDNLYLSTAEVRRANNVYYNGYGITSVLSRINLNKKNSEVLFKDDIRTFCVLEDLTILYVKNKQGVFGSEIWLSTPETRSKLWDSDMLINEIETNGKWIVASAGRQFENPDLYILDIETGDFQPIVQTPWTEGNIQFIKEDLLGFIANYDGKHRIYAVNLNKPESIFCYTNNAFVNSFVIDDTMLFFSGLNSDGFDIYHKPSMPELYTIKEYQPITKPDFTTMKIETKNGNYFDIAKTLFPAARLPVIFPMDSTFKKWLYGAVISGADATDENFYITIIGYDQLNEKPYLKSVLQSSFFSPLQMQVFYDYNDLINVLSSYPLYYSLQNIISQFSVSIDFRSFDEFTRKEVTPGFLCTIQKPYSSFFLNFAVPLERKFYKSSVDRTCIAGSAGLSHILLNGEFRVKSLGFLDPENPDTRSISIRGYEPINSHKGIVFRAEYSHRLLKIRKGLWNPNIYFEDVFGTLFFDYAFDENKKNYLSLGLEIGTETKVCFGFVQIFPRAGVAINRNKEISFFAGFNASTLDFP